MRRAVLGVLLLHGCLISCEQSAPRPAQQPPPPPPPQYSYYPPPPPQGPPPSGPPCIEQSYACSPDRAVLLQCRGGRFMLASTCRGPRGCVDGQAVACDHSVAAPGDACDDPGGIGCSTDRKSMLRCQNGFYTPAETCRNACLAAGGRVLCQ